MQVWKLFIAHWQRADISLRCAWACLVLALLLFISVLLPSWQQLSSTQDMLAQQALLRPVPASHHPQLAPPSPQALDLPKESQALNQISQILLMAQDYTVNLDKVDYQWHNKSGISQYQINLPVRGNYVAIRRYVSSLLQTQSNLTMQSINFERQDGAEPVRAQIQLVLYLHAGKGATHE